VGESANESAGKMRQAVARKPAGRKRLNEAMRISLSRPADNPMVPNRKAPKLTG
jgi:hypothetical protein